MIPFIQEVAVTARAFADALERALSDVLDRCPRCGKPDVVVVRADTKGTLYGACKACDEEVLL